MKQEGERVMGTEAEWREAIAEALSLQKVAERAGWVAFARQSWADSLGATAEELQVVENLRAAAWVAGDLTDDAWARVDAVRLAWKGPEEDEEEDTEW